MTQTGKVSRTDQLIKSPYATIKDWDRIVYRSPAAVTFKIVPISHQQTRISNNMQELVLKFKICHRAKILPFHLFSRLYEISPTNTTQLSDHWTMTYVSNKTVYVYVRFPSMCLYRLDVSAQFEENMFDKNMSQSFLCFQYLITHKSSAQSQPFPANCEWGATIPFLAAGFSVIKPTNVVLNVKNGKAVVKIKLPSWGYVANTCHLRQVSTEQTNSSLSIREIKLDECIYAEKCGCVATYYINCPNQGEYRFDMWAKYEPASSFHLGAAFLIKCENSCAQLYKQPSEVNVLSRLAGPWADFFKMGMTCSTISSTLQSDAEGNGVLVIRNVRQMSIYGKIKCANYPNCDELLSTITNDTHDVTFKIKKPTIPGYYWLLLYANETPFESHRCAGCFCLPSGFDL